ncbi:MAG: hypothetical protein RR741_06085 [Erysipelotrichaceae bacterium]
MNKTCALWMENELDAKQYLEYLIAYYPFDIDIKIVHSLLNKTTFPHPSLLEFIAYFSEITKYHYVKKIVFNDSSLLQLWANMAYLNQFNPYVLMTSDFSFCASIKTKKVQVHNPYAHLPLDKILFVDQIVLHHLPLLNTKVTSNHSHIIKSNEFIYKNLSMNHQDYVALSIVITNIHATIYIPKRCSSIVLSLCSMYALCPPPTHVDFICIYGLNTSHNMNHYYHDETNRMMIGLISGDEDIDYFGCIKNMISCLYHTLCIEKNDLPIQGSMLELEKDNKLFSIVFLGNQGSGKSEMIEELSKQAIKNGYQPRCIFDDVGTLHYLDNDIWATGCEIGSFIGIDNSRNSFLFNHLSHSIFMNTKQKNAHLIEPATLSKENIFAFHKVNALFYLNNYDMKDKIHFFTNLNEGKEVFLQGKFMNNDSIPQFQEIMFANPYGILQNKEKSLALIHKFLDIIYINNINIGEIYTKFAYEEYRLLGLVECGVQLMNYINTCY